jgi:hypothetical protein
MITEKDLEEAGFEKITVPHEESQNGYDYHFYSNELWDDISLYADENDSWCIKCYQITGLRIKNIEDFHLFVNLLDKIMEE